MSFDRLQKLLAVVCVISVIASVGFYLRSGFKTYDIKVTGGAESERNIRIYVSGEVVNPGEYALPEGSRVCDAIYTAGGITKSADTELLDLAAVVTDSLKIDVPAKGGIRTGAPVININTADAGELMLIPYIGEEMASRIVEYRLNNGKFKQPNDITRVKGIGEKTFNKIKDYIKTEEQPQ